MIWSDLYNYFFVADCKTQNKMFVADCKTQNKEIHMPRVTDSLNTVVYANWNSTIELHKQKIQLVRCQWKELSTRQIAVRSLNYGAVAGLNPTILLMLKCKGWKRVPDYYVTLFHVNQLANPVLDSSWVHEGLSWGTQANANFCEGL